MTAAAEHGTALLSENWLGRPETQTMPFDEEVRALMNWHTFEELEHKAVALDVYRAVGGPEWVRVAALLLFLMPAPTMLQLLARSLARDPAARNPIRVAHGVARLSRAPEFRGTVLRALRFARPGFHPDDIDTRALLEKSRAELFGETGKLVDHLR